jgi:hypothetical protein
VVGTRRGDGSRALVRSFGLYGECGVGVGVLKNTFLFIFPPKGGGGGVEIGGEEKERHVGVRLFILVFFTRLLLASRASSFLIVQGVKAMDVRMIRVGMCEQRRMSTGE